MITKEEWKGIRGSSPSPDQIMISIKGDAAHNMAIRWRADVSVNDGYVLYREKGAEKWLKEDSEMISFTTDMDESHFFFAHLKELKADRCYEYSCGNDENRSDIYTFKTAKENLTKFSFICISDIQAGDAEPPADYSSLNEMLKKALSEHPECDFILTGGDNTNCGQTDIQWTGLFEGLKGIMESKPVMFCMGNHDDMGFSSYFTKEEKYYSEHAEYFTNQLWGCYEHNGPEGWIVANHSFDYGNARFCLTGTSGYEEMNDWLIKMADESDKKWKFAVHHFPLCFTSPVLEIEDTYPTMREGMEKYDIVFSGHEHSFSRSFPRRREGLYDKPSQGTIHYMLGSSNRNPPAGVVSKVWNAKTYCHEEVLSMFSIVDIDGDKCTLTAYLEDGRVVDNCVIDKSTDTILPIDTAPLYRYTRLLFKGYDPGICMLGLAPRTVDDTWYIPIGQLISFMGGNVERTEGKIKIGVYGRTSQFTENSTRVITQSGEYDMEAPCLRLSQGQLFAPLEGFCKNLRMHPYYYEHNNFIDIESEVQHVPMAHQP